MPVPTAETFSFAEGKLFLWASASGAGATGSGIAFCQDSTIRFNYGWIEYRSIDAVYLRFITGQRVDMSIANLLSDTQMWRLVQASAAINARFEGTVTGGLSRSAIWQLYSGVVEQAQISQAEGTLFRGNYTMHANEWSAFGQ